MSKHQLSHFRLLTGDMGQLLPVGLIEVLPGDRFRHSTSAMLRLSPMAAPVMHPLSVRLHHFFVPHRLSWPDGYATTWEDFITGGPTGNESNPVPTISTTGVAKDVLDYLGLPVTAGIEVSSLPLRAFNLIYNEWYRDQDLATLRTEEATDIPLISWEKDYFTTARPWAQKGDEVTLPLGDKAVVHSGNFNEGAASYNHPAGGDAGYTPTGSAPDYTWNDQGGNNTGIWADLSTAASAKVNDIRRAFALQRFAEVRARFGSRYPEYLAYLGVRSPDARLQRPEYLGGGTSRVSISEVLQTAPDDSGDPRFGVADMYGHGVGMARSSAYRKRFTEHGYVLTMMSVRPKQMFSEGIERTWLRRDREDFWQKELEHIGQQEVWQQEVYADGTNKDVVFGYSDRYAEYRTQRSLVTSEFRNTLDYWHLARQFQTAPVLNSTFVECDPSKRIFNEQTQDSLWCAVQHQVQTNRLVSKNAYARMF